MGGEGFNDAGGRARLRRPLLRPAQDWLLADHAAHGFHRRTPGLSARRTLSSSQEKAGRQVVLLLCLLTLLVPELPGIMIAAVAPPVFVAIIVFRLWLLCVARLRRSAPPEAEASVPFLPVYTILIALKDEAAVMPQLARAMAGLDYPEERIDLKLLVEESDQRTQAAIRAVEWPSQTELLVVPPGNPQTKPRALNYGLARARGTYVVVYDAEDRPHPSQLKTAVEGFNAAGLETVCLQAPLVGVPAKGGWLARQWALEYAIQFGLIVPALARLGLPVALGGTSNHFRRTALVKAGGWDAWNVTEDADLGLRLARLGHRVGAITSPTLEAPPEEGGVWRGQRSRWLKGYMQTWCVLMRNGSEAPGLTPVSFAAVQLTLGAAILSAIVHGPWAVWCAACLISPELSLGPFGLAALISSLSVGLLSAILAPGRRGGWRLFDLLTLPLYWPLQTLAMGRAVWSLVHKPHYWAKTPHI
jgi:cellulose synthase/poly-beta-1,6-N-acetylglucosamine synthase-like glycosyltransferase